MDDNRNGDNNKTPQNRKIFFACLIVTLIMVIFFSYFTKNMSKDSVQEITYDNFLSMLENDNISEVLIKSDRLVIKPKNRSSAYGYEQTFYTGTVYDPELVNRLSEKGIKFAEEIVDSSTTIIDIFLAYILPFIIIYGLMFLLFRCGAVSASAEAGEGSL